MKTSLLWPQSGGSVLRGWVGRREDVKLLWGRWDARGRCGAAGLEHIWPQLFFQVTFSWKQTTSHPPKGAVSNSSSYSIHRIFTQWFTPFLQGWSACPDHIQSPITSWEWPYKAMGKHCKQWGTGWGFGVSARCRGFAQGNKSSSTFLEFATGSASPLSHKELLDYLRALWVRPLKREGTDLHTVVAFQTVQEQLLRGFTHLCSKTNTFWPMKVISLLIWVSSALTCILRIKFCSFQFLAVQFGTDWPCDRKLYTLLIMYTPLVMFTLLIIP